MLCNNNTKKSHNMYNDIAGATTQQQHTRLGNHNQLIFSNSDSEYKEHATCITSYKPQTTMSEN